MVAFEVAITTNRTSKNINFASKIVFVFVMLIQASKNPTIIICSQEGLLAPADTKPFKPELINSTLISLSKEGLLAPADP